MPIGAPPGAAGNAESQIDVWTDHMQLLLAVDIASHLSLPAGKGAPVGYRIGRIVGRIDESFRVLRQLVHRWQAGSEHEVSILIQRHPCILRVALRRKQRAYPAVRIIRVAQPAHVHVVDRLIGFGKHAHARRIDRGHGLGVHLAHDTDSAVEHFQQLDRRW